MLCMFPGTRVSVGLAWMCLCCLIWRDCFEIKASVWQRPFGNIQAPFMS